jgi:hypothetical protein
MTACLASSVLRASYSYSFTYTVFVCGSYSHTASWFNILYLGVRRYSLARPSGSSFDRGGTLGCGTSFCRSSRFLRRRDSVTSQGWSYGVGQRVKDTPYVAGVERKVVPLAAVHDGQACLSIKTIDVD